MERKILGKPTYYAPKTMTTATTGLATTVTNYSYVKDDCGCITAATSTTNGNSISRFFYYEKVPE
ncbi:MAG: hypothetical protein U5M51_06370 [Emticicia sp.]|nr:hypothetical protein [Emticicia sp.]